MKPLYYTYSDWLHCVKKIDDIDYFSMPPEMDEQLKKEYKRYLIENGFEKG
jgi:hypothetical protein